MDEIALLFVYKFAELKFAWTRFTSNFRILILSTFMIEQFATAVLQALTKRYLLLRDHVAKTKA